jgi:hypothetical protein
MFQTTFVITYEGLLILLFTLLSVPTLKFLNISTSGILKHDTSNIDSFITDQGIAVAWIDILIFLSVAASITKYLPQLILNSTRETTLGLNIDSIYWDILTNIGGLIILYNFHTYPDITYSIIDSSIYGMNALFLLNIFGLFFSLLILYQCKKFDKNNQKISPFPMSFSLVIVLVSILYFAIWKISEEGGKDFWVAFADWQSFFTHLTIGLTMFRYIPQIVANRKYKLYIGVDICSVFLTILSTLPILVLMFVESYNHYPNLNEMTQVFADNSLLFANALVITLLNILLAIQCKIYYKRPALLKKVLTKKIEQMDLDFVNQFAHDIPEYQMKIAFSNSGHCMPNRTEEWEDPSSSVDAFGNSIWICSRCTCQNPEFRDTCSACDVSREENLSLHLSSS